MGKLRDTWSFVRKHRLVGPILALLPLTLVLGGLSIWLLLWAPLVVLLLGGSIATVLAAGWGLSKITERLP